MLHWTAFAGLDKAELHLLAGEGDLARQLIVAAQREHVRNGTIRTPESIRANRLHVELLALTDPERSLQPANRLLALATEIFGEDHRETLLVRTSLAEALAANDRSEEAAEIWRAVGKTFHERANGQPCRDVAHCLSGLVFATMGDYPSIDCSFEGDPALLIEPQLQCTPHYPPETLQAIKLLGQAIEMHLAIGGEEDPHAKALRALGRRMQSEMEESIFLDRRDAATKVREQLLAILTEQRREEIALWRAENPEPLVKICTGEFADAYHRGDCHHIESCGATVRTVTATNAIMQHRRRSCLTCEPPGPNPIPKDFYNLPFNGTVVRITP
jgi:hypothetical protein